MSDDIAIDIKDPEAAELLRDLAYLRKLKLGGHKALVAKSALEQLVVLEARGHFAPQAIAQLRASVLRELTRG